MDEIGARLVGLVRSGEAATQAQLIRASGFARATVASRLEALVASGVLVEGELVRDTGGRPAAQLMINSRRGVLLGADVGGSHARIAAFDLRGRLLEVDDHVVSITAGPDAVLGLLAGEFESLTTAHGYRHDQVRAIAVGMPGPVEQSSGRIVSPPTMPGWDGTDVRSYFAARFDAPVVVDKDANIMAIGEHRVLDDPIDDMLLLKVGMGIGGGIIANGRILRGSQGAAGDLGHLPRRGGAPCRCGQEGCAEATAGGWAIARELRDRGYPDVRTSRDIVELVRSREPLALELLRRAGLRLGEVLAEAIGVLNPSRVIIGGNLSAAGDELLAAIRERVYDQSHPLATKNLRITLGELGDDAGIMGAAELAGDAAFGLADLARVAED